MAYVLYLVGGGILFVGGVWTWSVLSSPDVGSPGYETYAMAGRLLAVAPGISTILGGILFIALGAGLDYLAQIARASKRTARLLDEQFRKAE